jgi:fructokinase
VCSCAKTGEPSIPVHRPAPSRQTGGAESGARSARIGVDLGGTKIEAVAMTGAGAIAARRRVATPTGDYDATVAAVAAIVAAIEAEIGAETDVPATVGIGIPGVVSPRTGLVKNANSEWLIGRPLGRDLKAALARPVRIANDANCFALSEAWDGAAQGAAVVFGAILGTGVGGGIVADGRVLEGVNAIAGEWGHNPLPWPEAAEMPGRECYCGRRGCIETFLSGPGMAADHLAVTGARLEAGEIARRADGGDAACAETLGRYEGRLARALATVINTLDPEVIVLGGGLSNMARIYRNVPPLWPRYVFSDTVLTRLVAPAHGDSSGVRGAARLWPPPAESGT